MLNYATIDYLPDLSSLKIATAPALTFSTYVPALVDVPTDWDNAAIYSTNARYALLNSTFRWTGTEGATYDIASSSFFDPFLIQVYDNLGNVIAVDGNGFDPYGRDYVWNFVAPYTGTFYVSAGWDQGEASSHLYVSLSIYEDVDTALKQIIGTFGNDNLFGTGRPEDFYATHGNDVVQGNGGNDLIHGFTGIDTAVYRGNRAEYSVTLNSTGTSVADRNVERDGTDTVDQVERIKFADQSIAFDVTGNAGITAKIIGAVFGKAAVGNRDYVGIGLRELDAGVSKENLMHMALGAKLGANFSYAAAVNLLYENVIGTPPSISDLNFYTGLLEDGLFSPGSLGMMAADTTQNITNIELVGLSATGIAYI